MMRVVEEERKVAVGRRRGGSKQFAGRVGRKKRELDLGGSGSRNRF
jgi:hypothetical protein